MSHLLEPISRTATELGPYDWLVKDEIAYRVHKVEIFKRDKTNLVRVRLSDGSVYQYRADDLITVLHPKNG